MTDQPTCTAGCGRPSPDAMLCTGCTRQLERILAELPAHLAELEVTLTRQARTTRGSGGKPTKAPEPPLPYDVTASNLTHRVRNGLSTWIRHLAENGSTPRHQGPMHPVGGCQHDSCWEIRTGVPTIERTDDMAVWLVAQMREIRQDEAAGELLANLNAIRSELRAAVDNRQYRYAGTCRAVLRPLELTVTGDVTRDVPGDVTDLGVEAVTGDSAPCGADLRLRVGAKTIVCRDCGAEYDAAEQAAWIDKESADQLATGPMIAKALADAGYRVKPALIRNWAERTRQWMHRAAHRKDGDPPLAYEEHPIQQIACQVESRLPLYRVGDVYRRVKADPERRIDADQIGA